MRQDESLLLHTARRYCARLCTIYYAIALLFLTCNNGHLYPYPPRRQPTPSLPQTAMTQAVLKRFYIIARLEKLCTNFFASTVPDHASLIALLPSFLQAAFTSTAAHPALPVLTEIFPLLRHDYLRSTIALARTTGNLEPLHKLWKELCAYRFLDDELLIEEFARILYTLLAHSLPNTKDTATGYDEHALFVADIQAITQRFYLIQRLQHAVALCIEKHGSSQDPAMAIMLALWDDIRQYKNIDKITVSFGICSSIITLLKAARTANDNEPNPVEPATPEQTPEDTSSAPYPEGNPNSTAADHAELEKLLEYIDALTDSYSQIH